jgi:proteic killer suppression protein
MPALSLTAGSGATLAVCTAGWVHTHMIVSFREEWLRAFFIEDTRSRNIPPDLESRLFRKLQMIDDATTDQDLRAPQQSFEKLRGNLAGFYSVRVNSEVSHVGDKAQAGDSRRDPG